MSDYKSKQNKRISFFLHFTSCWNLASFKCIKFVSLDLASVSVEKFLVKVCLSPYLRVRTVGEGLS